jgi:hypothetical protein
MKTVNLTISSTLADYTLDCWAVDCDPPKKIGQRRFGKRGFCDVYEITSLEQLKEFEAQADQQADSCDMMDSLHYAAKNALPRLTKMVKEWQNA